MKIEYKASVGKNPNFLKSTVEISQKCNHYLIFFMRSNIFHKFRKKPIIILICRTTRIFSSDQIVSINQTTEIFTMLQARLHVLLDLKWQARLQFLLGL